MFHFIHHMMYTSRTRLQLEMRAGPKCFLRPSIPKLRQIQTPNSIMSSIASAKTSSSGPAWQRTDTSQFGLAASVSYAHMGAIMGHKAIRMNALRETSGASVRIICIEKSSKEAAVSYCLSLHRFTLSTTTRRIRKFKSTLWVLANRFRTPTAMPVQPVLLAH